MNNISKLIENFHEVDKKLEVVSKLLEQHLKDDTENLTRIVESLSNIDKRIDENTIYLNKNTYQLELHIQGVKAAQENNTILREELNIYKREVESKLKELEKPKIVAKGILWLIGALTATGGLILLVKQLL